MRLKLKGNPTPDNGVVEFYRRAALVSLNAHRTEEERIVGRILWGVLDADNPGNPTDNVMQCLANFEAATRRIREELRGIHS